MSELIWSTLRLSVPIVFAALGGLFSERSGVANVALEGLLLVGAFVAGAVAATTHNLELAIAAALVATMICSLGFGVICIFGRADQIVVGMGFNMLVAGIIPVLCKSWFEVTGSTPALSGENRLSSGFVLMVLAFIAAAVAHLIFGRTLFGLRLSAAGEEPYALQTQGLSYRWYRLVGLAICGALVSLGGVSLSLWQGSGYIRDMAAGRGFIALAALIFGGWRPWPTLVACLLFSFADAVQIQLQGQTIADIKMPSQLIQVLPYIFTLFILALGRQKMQAPRAINTELD